MDKEDVVQLSCGISFYHQKEGNPTICKNMEEIWRLYAKWDTPERGIKILYDVTYAESKKSKLVKSENT